MASSLRFTVTGLAKHSAQLKRIQEKSPDRFGRALRAETDIEVKEVVKNTPVATGALAATVRAEGPVRVGKKIRCTIVAGSAAVDYALIVHEDLEAFHRTGEAKFIERTLNESAPYLPARIAARLHGGGTE